jgi:hypothetical protein
MESKKCVNCSQWNLKKSGAMAKQGFALCLKGPAYVFLSPRNVCPKHEPAPAGAEAARVAWLRPQALKDAMSSAKSEGAAPPRSR